MIQFHQIITAIFGFIFSNVKKIILIISPCFQGIAYLPLTLFYNKASIRHIVS